VDQNALVNVDVTKVKSALVAKIVLAVVDVQIKNKIIEKPPRRWFFSHKNGKLSL